MKRRQKLTYFLAGLLSAVVLGGAVNPALAAMAGKTIQVFTGVNIYIDDVKLNPKDANGNPVEAFIYNGTTYLPVRAVGEAVGKTVQWEGSTSSVYLGKHSGGEPAVWLAEMDYFSGSESIRTATSEMDNLGNTHYHCITYPFERTYKLNGQYSLMTGTLYQTYEERSKTIGEKSCLEIYGDGRLLHTISFPERMTGFEPSDFSVNLTGVLELRVVLKIAANYHSGTYDTLLSLGDVGLWT